jgi:hypothetical protein
LREKNNADTKNLPTTHPTKVASSKVSYKPLNVHGQPMESEQAELISAPWNQGPKAIDTLGLKVIHFYESSDMVCNAIRLFSNRKINVWYAFTTGAATTPWR